MEKISINNYPAWITDYHDGTLQGERLEEMFAFLSQHPELMEEFEQYDHAPLYPDLSVRSHIKGLIREFGELTLSQQEELTAALAEGDITGEEADEIMTHIEASAHLTGLYRSLKAIRLLPADIPFPGKKSLKHYPLVPRFNKAVVTIMASAASIAILFSISILLNRDQPLSVPFAGSSEIDPVIIIDKDRSNSQATAGNIAVKPEEAESSEHSDEGISLTEINAAAENDTSVGRTADEGNRNAAAAENDTSVGRTADEGNRNAAAAENDTSVGRTADEGNRNAATIDASAYGQVITAGDSAERLTTGITEEKELPGSGISADTREGNSYNLSPIREHLTPSIKERTSATAQLAEMVPIDVTEDNYTGSPREFIAKNFRKLVFNDQNATSEPLKPIELADATVTGINKLLGWEMKLEQKNDDNGTLNSISFASHLVKFDHNLKNSGN